MRGRLALRAVSNSKQTRPICPIYRRVVTTRELFLRRVVSTACSPEQLLVAEAQPSSVLAFCYRSQSSTSTKRWPRYRSRSINLWKSRTHRSAVDESEAAVHATNAPYRQGRPTAVAHLPSRHAKLRRSLLELILRRTSAPTSCSALNPRVSGASTTHDDDRSV